MTYSTAGKKAAIKYVKDKQKQITIRYRMTDFNEKIAPAIKKSGLPMATYIKQAIDEKIDKDNKSKD